MKNTENSTKTKKVNLNKVKKNTEKKNQVVDKKNVANVKESITKVKDLKYIYKKGCDNLVDRKKFRTSTRGKINTALGKIAKAGKKEKITLMAELRTSCEKVLTQKGMTHFGIA